MKKLKKQKKTIDIVNNSQECNDVDYYMKLDIIVNVKLELKELQHVRNSIEYHVINRFSKEEILESLLIWFTD